MSMTTTILDVHGVLVEVRSSRTALPLLQELIGDFGIFKAPAASRASDLLFSVVSASDGGNTLAISAKGRETTFVWNDGETAREAWVNRLRPGFTPRITELLLAQGDTLLVHASAAIAPSGGVAFVGEKGAGKSSLCYLMVLGGWKYLSNDLLYLGLKGGEVQCLGLPQELTLGAAANLWFERDDAPSGSLNLENDLQRLHGTDAGKKKELRHDSAVLAKRAPLRRLLFPEPGINSSKPVARRLGAGEIAQKLVANTQTSVRWGYAPTLGVGEYLACVNRVVTAVASENRIEAYLLRWGWDHGSNRSLIEELASDHHA